MATATAMTAAMNDTDTKSPTKNVIVTTISANTKNGRAYFRNHNSYPQINYDDFFQNNSTDSNAFIVRVNTKKYFTKGDDDDEDDADDSTDDYDDDIILMDCNQQTKRKKEMNSLKKYPSVLDCIAQCCGVWNVRKFCNNDDSGFRDNDFGNVCCNKEEDKKNQYNGNNDNDCTAVQQQRQCDENTTATIPEDGNDNDDSNDWSYFSNDDTDWSHDFYSTMGNMGDGGTTSTTNHSDDTTMFVLFGNFLENDTNTNNMEWDDTMHLANKNYRMPDGADISTKTITTTSTATTTTSSLCTNVQDEKLEEYTNTIRRMMMDGAAAATEVEVQPSCNHDDDDCSSSKLDDSFRSVFKRSVAIDPFCQQQPLENHEIDDITFIPSSYDDDNSIAVFESDDHSENYFTDGCQISEGVVQQTTTNSTDDDSLYYDPNKLYGTHQQQQQDYHHHEPIVESQQLNTKTSNKDEQEEQVIASDSSIPTHSTTVSTLEYCFHNIIMNATKYDNVNYKLNRNTTDDCHYFNQRRHQVGSMNQQHQPIADITIDPYNYEPISMCYKATIDMKKKNVMLPPINEENDDADECNDNEYDGNSNDVVDDDALIREVLFDYLKLGGLHSTKGEYCTQSSPFILTDPTTATVKKNKRSVRQRRRKRNDVQRLFQYPIAIEFQEKTIDEGYEKF